MALAHAALSHIQLLYNEPNATAKYGRAWLDTRSMKKEAKKYGEIVKIIDRRMYWNAPQQPAHAISELLWSLVLVSASLPLPLPSPYKTKQKTVTIVIARTQ